MPSASGVYELWETNEFLGVFRDVETKPVYWLNWFGNELRSTDEWIDFEKLPVQKRKLASFTMPLARGNSVYEDSGKHMRFKPAYVKVEDRVDELMPLYRRVGIDATATQLTDLTPVERLNLIKTAMTIAQVQSINDRWEWMAARSIIDGKLTIKGENYPTTDVDFLRDPSHTEVLGAGARFTDAGVSIVDYFQRVVDKMVDAEFGGVPTRCTMGGGVWAIIRKNAEFRDHMDTNIRGGNITIERGLVTGEKVFKVGEMQIGGASGQTIELWVNNETYLDPDTGVQTRYLGANEMVFTSTADALQGFRCFGRIIDRAAGYEALPIFPKNWEQYGDTVTEYITHKSAPIFVPINPNTTFKSTPI